MTQAFAERCSLRRHSREGGNPRCAATLDSRPGIARPVLSLSEGGNDGTLSKGFVCQEMRA
jgi:hypothetical protein